MIIPGPDHSPWRKGLLVSSSLLTGLLIIFLFVLVTSLFILIDDLLPYHLVLLILLLLLQIIIILLHFSLTGHCLLFLWSVEGLQLAADGTQLEILQIVMSP